MLASACDGEALPGACRTWESLMSGAVQSQKGRLPSTLCLSRLVGRSSQACVQLAGISMSAGALGQGHAVPGTGRCLGLRCQWRAGCPSSCALCGWGCRAAAVCPPSCVCALHCAAGRCCCAAGCALPSPGADPLQAGHNCQQHAGYYRRAPRLEYTSARHQPVPAQEAQKNCNGLCTV